MPDDTTAPTERRDTGAEREAAGFINGMRSAIETTQRKINLKHTLLVVHRNNAADLDLDVEVRAANERVATAISREQRDLLDLLDSFKRRVHVERQYLRDLQEVDDG